MTAEKNWNREPPEAHELDDFKHDAQMELVNALHKLPELDLDANETDGIEDDDPVRHLRAWILGARERAVTAALDALRAASTPAETVKYYCSQCAASWEGIGVPNTCPECLMPAATVEGLREELRITHEKLHAVERMWQRDRPTPEAGSPAEDDLEARLEVTASYWAGRRYGDKGLRLSAEAVVKLLREAAARLRARPQQGGER